MDRTLRRERRTYSDPALPIDAFRIGGSRCLLEAHWHPDVEILYVERGSVLFTIEGERIVAQAGTAVVANTRELHTAVSTDAAESWFHAIVFDPVLLSGAGTDRDRIGPGLSADGRLPLPRRIPGASAAELDALRICRELVERLKEHPRKAARIRSLLFGWLAGLDDAGLLAAEQDPVQQDVVPDRVPSRFETIKASLSILHDRFDARLTVAELAAAANLSEFHFYRVFRQATGRSPVEYLNEVRCRRAAHLLLTTDSTVLRVALEVGFSSSAYFIRVFRRHAGCTPLRYRKDRAATFPAS